jgi:hypothetical protein
MKKVFGESYVEFSKIKEYGPCKFCGNDKEDELNFEAAIHHNSEVRCFDLKECGRRQRKGKIKGA